ncbi:MAG: hypothetical protein H6598_01560 [Flavobacteriales bacterium]|nr:hypothetical protein [Flavobacteriales bacterium]
MAENFKRILRSKSAEQLSNMYRNKADWSTEELEMINAEIKNRGVETFEEPEEWSEEEMENLDLINPSTQFEKDMAFLIEEKERESRYKPLALAAQITSISSCIVNILYLYLFLNLFDGLGVILANIIAITSLILFITKQYLYSIILGGLSLVFCLYFLVNQLLTEMA